MHLHLAFGDTVLIDLRVALSLFHREADEAEREEVPAAPLGFQASRGGEPVGEDRTCSEPQ